jgi:hypothetical protein
MTLKEKFLNSPCELGYVNTNEYRAENNVKIADRYAIGFARFYKMANNNEYHLYPDASIEEHLEIYKKESGL